MDFLKTLLAYMALMATLSVQEGPAPQTVPTPTPLPVGVTATPLPNQTPSPTATPAPSATAGPALTPNKRYTKVAFGDKGTAVKKLQNRLIALGYMPAGSADSQYGYQTYNAVKAFQKANGLEVDGVAGPITLTYLYENPNVVGVVEPTEVPTATPTPSLPPLPTPEPVAEATPVAAVTIAPTEIPAATATPTEEPTAAPTVAIPEGDAPAYPETFSKVKDAYIISGTDGATLTYANAERVQVRPALWLNEFGAATVSLSQLADCLEGWSFHADSANGPFTLKACGYVVTIELQELGMMVLVDDYPASIPEDEILLDEGTLFVSEGFLRSALGANTIYDLGEHSLLLFLKDKSVADAQD